MCDFSKAVLERGIEQGMERILNYFEIEFNRSEHTYKDVLAHRNKSVEKILGLKLPKKY